MTTRRRSRHNGEGSIRKRADGRWEGKYTAGHTPEGKQVRRSVYGRTRAEAAEKLKQKLAATPKAAVVMNDAGKLTVAHQARLQLELRRAELSAGTVMKHQSYVRIIEKHPLGGIALQKLKPAHIEGFYRDLSANYVADTVRHIAVFLKQTLRRAVRHELIAINPADVAELPRLQSKERATPLRPDEVARLLKEARGYRLYPLFATIASLGLRHGEALGLQWGDIDFETDTLQIQRTVVSRSGRPVVSRPKTATSFRTLYLPPTLKALLEEHGHCAKLMGANNSKDWVFSNANGGMLSQHNVRRVWRQLLIAAELNPKTRIHDLRHTFISRLIEHGTDPRTAADLAGHSDPSITLRVYTHSHAQQRKAALLKSAESLLPVEAE